MASHISIFFLFTFIVSVFSIQYDIDAISSNYLQLQIRDSEQSISDLQLSVVNWDKTPDLSSAEWEWVSLKYTSASNYYTFAVPREYGAIVVPTSFRVVSGSSSFVEQFILKNISAVLLTGNCDWASNCEDFSTPPAPREFTAGNNHLGVCTWDANAAADACLLQSAGDGLNEFFTEHHVAVSESLFDEGNGEHCGECLKIRSSLHPEWILAIMIDVCPANFPGVEWPNPCARLNWLDVSPKIFQKLTNGHCGHYGETDWGVMEVEWEFASCVPYENEMISYVVRSGCDAFWFEIQARRHDVGLAGLHIRSVGTNEWVALKRENYNFFTGGDPSVECPCDLQLTSEEGEVLTDLNIIPAWSTLTAAEHVIQGTVQFSEGLHGSSSSSGGGSGSSSSSNSISNSSSSSSSSSSCSSTGSGDQSDSGSSAGSAASNSDLESGSAYSSAFVGWGVILLAFLCSSLL